MSTRQTPQRSSIPSMSTPKDSRQGPTTAAATTTGTPGSRALGTRTKKASSDKIQQKEQGKQDGIAGPDSANGVKSTGKEGQESTLSRNRSESEPLQYPIKDRTPAQEQATVGVSTNREWEWEDVSFEDVSRAKVRLCCVCAVFCVCVSMHVCVVCCVHVCHSKPHLLSSPPPFFFFFFFFFFLSFLAVVCYLLPYCCVAWL